MLIICWGSLSLTLNNCQPGVVYTDRGPLIQYSRGNKMQTRRWASKLNKRQQDQNTAEEIPTKPKQIEWLENWFMEHVYNKSQ